MQIQIQKRKSSASRDFPKKKDGQINEIDEIWEELMQGRWGQNFPPNENDILPITAT